jgi:lipopolysaccharide heptosyltransferase I
MDDPKKILIIRLSAIGDVIRTLPALHLLRKKYPESWIGWAVEEKSAPIIEGHEALNEIILVPRKSWVRSLKNPLKWLHAITDISNFLRDLKRRDFDTVIDFHSSLKSGIISLSTGARYRIGYTAPFCREFNFLFNNVRLPLREKRISRLERNFTLLKHFHIEANECIATLSITPGEKNYIDDFLKREGLSERKKIIIFPGASKRQAYKKWGSDRYATLASMLIQGGVAIILGWGPGEREECEEIISSTDGAIFLSPPTSLKHLAELIKRCQLYIGGDTAAMHLSCAVGTPCLIIYGPTDPVINAPWGEESRIVYDDTVDCSPCRKRRCKKRDCFQNITTELVYQEAQEMIKSWAKA